MTFSPVDVAARLRETLQHARDNWGEYKGLLSLDGAFEYLRDLDTALLDHQVTSVDGLETTAASREALARWIETTGDLNIPCGTSTAAVLRDVDRLTARLRDADVGRVAELKQERNGAMDERDAAQGHYDGLAHDLEKAEAALAELRTLLTKMIADIDAALTG